MSLENHENLLLEQVWVVDNESDVCFAVTIMVLKKFRFQKSNQKSFWTFYGFSRASKQKAPSIRNPRLQVTPKPLFHAFLMKKIH